MQLVRIGLEHPDAALRGRLRRLRQCARAGGTTPPRFRLGYRPDGRAEDHLKDALAGQAKLPPDPIADMFEGGPFCSDEFAGDPETRGG